MTISNDKFSQAICFAQQYIKPKEIKTVSISAAAATLIGISLLADKPETIPSTFGKLCFAVASPIVGIGVGKLACKIVQITDATVRRIQNSWNSMQIAKAITSSQNKPQSMLIFRTTYDKNDAFVSSVEVNRIKKFADSHSIELLTGCKKAEVARNMDAIKKQYDQVVVKAHSTAQTLRLGYEFVLTKNSKKTMAWFNDHIKEDGAIVIEGCSSAAGEDNIAREISSACPHAYVYGSDSDLIHGIGIHYDQDCLPTFYDYGPIDESKDNFDGMLEESANPRNSTRVYKNGQLLPPVG